MKKIIIIVAMEEEAKPIIKALNLSFDKKSQPISIYSNKEKNIFLSTNGIDHRFNVDLVGTQPAALNAYIMIHTYQPEIIINAGTAGGFHSKGASVGDVYLGNGEFCFHDRRIPISGFDEYGIGSYKSIDTKAMAKNLGLKTGKISSGNSLDYSIKDEEMTKQINPSLKDMEAASIAWVCDLFNTDLIAIKGITNLVDKEIAADSFLANFNLATTNLTAQTKLLVKSLMNQP